MLWAFLFIVNFGVKSAEGQISFKIQNAYTGKKVVSTIKILKDNNLLTEARSSEKREFMLPEGKYDFYFNAEGYSPLKTYFYITKNKKINVTVYLSPLDKKSLFLPEREGLTGIRGYVTNTEGKPLERVEVTLKGKNLKTLTDNKGIFEFWFQIPEREYESPEDIPKDTLILDLKGYKTVKREIILIPENAIFKIKMEKGKGEKFVPEIRGKGTGGEETPSPEEKRGEIDENILRTPLDPPSSIRVGKPCDCTDCYDVVVMDLEHYVASGLDDEWIASWAQHSLRSGAIPYRSYGTWYVFHPLHQNYDICDNACCQVWDGDDIYQSCITAAHITNGILLERNGTYARSEYSAENNDCGCGDGYAGTGTTWPCIYDPLCAGHACYGHGRGMCQWGTSRWANSGEYWKWITEHYYEPGNMFIATPIIITSSNPSPGTVAPGDTFIIYYDVNSYCEENHENILLGASIYDSSVGFISDPPNDSLVTIIPGTQTVSRIFVLPSNTPSGTYDLYTALWLDVDEDAGINSNDLDLYLFISHDALIVQPTGVSEEKLPPNFELVSQNAKKFGWLKISPNLVYQKVNLKFSTPEGSRISFEIIDVTGKKVKKIFKRYLKRGIYNYSLNTQFLKAGIYFLILENDKKNQSVQKIEIIR